MTAEGDQAVVCTACGNRYVRRAGVWRFLTPARHERLAPFIRQYRVVRQQEGHRVTAPDYYRRLPTVRPDDPHADDWQIRRETYHHLLGHVLATGPLPLHILDLGAGSGWLSHRLSALGHRAVAVDALDDDADGLGAARFYDRQFAAVQADFDALPFAPAQFDLVVFNGSLHYAPDLSTTLERAHRMLAPGGALVVMDSPMFGADGDGSRMVGDMLRRFTVVCGTIDAVQPGIGYVTFATLRAIANRLNLRPHFVPSRGPLAWRLRRHIARVRLRRAPAAFGLWVAR
ncbi:MAG TPA: class I SAM-dependent methyltransferase [Vicinamibacterales bacterium]|nr:class I SAM-dependent methyltransferase [Vicinamibacterales bacterium]